jgi:hypothetical protein
MLTLLIVSIALAGHGTIYLAAFIGQVLLYVAALAAWLNYKLRKGYHNLDFCFHFLMVNLSIFLGWFRFLFGKQDITWDPHRGY